jgi:hypothetical protein
MGELLHCIGELGTAGRDLLAEVERLAAQAQAERLAARRSAQTAKLKARVAAELAEHPDASANDLWRTLRGERLGSRAAILQAVGEARRAVSRSQPGEVPDKTDVVQPPGGQPGPVLAG